MSDYKIIEAINFKEFNTNEKWKEKEKEDTKIHQNKFLNCFFPLMLVLIVFLLTNALKLI